MSFISMPSFRRQKNEGAKGIGDDERADDGRSRTRSFFGQSNR
jgi:hypothetical protein